MDTEAVYMVDVEGEIITPHPVTEAEASRIIHRLPMDVPATTIDVSLEIEALCDLATDD